MMEPQQSTLDVMLGQIINISIGTGSSINSYHVALLCIPSGSLDSPYARNGNGEPTLVVSPWVERPARHSKTAHFRPSSWNTTSTMNWALVFPEGVGADEVEVESVGMKPGEKAVTAGEGYEVNLAFFEAMNNMHVALAMDRQIKFVLSEKRLILRLQ
jgi:hypothetical protein